MCSRRLYTKMSEFSGKRALVTGAGKGIGRACVKALHEAGAELFALSRTKSDLDSLKEELPEVNTICSDVADWSKTKELVRKSLPIDLLVNNAGICIKEPFLTASEKSYDDMMATNTKSAYMISQLVANDMVERKCAGSIVNVSTFVSAHGFADNAAYCMSKAAMDAMTRTMAVELGPYNIRTNSVNPSLTLTDSRIKIWFDPAKADMKNRLLARTPLGRFAQVKDVTDQILHFLSAEKSSMLNGVILHIDGGFSVT